MRPGKVLIFVVVVYAVCCTRNIPPVEIMRSSPVEGRLQSFFAMCERDIKNAVGVIGCRDLIKNLTHLHRMNAGGKKYYLLERENITEMIRSVTEGVYSDFILINRHGIVIYTRENDDLFGKKVTSALIDTPLDRSFKNSEHPLHIEDISAFPTGSGQYNLFISGDVSREGASHGIFILQVNAEKIGGLLESGARIIDFGGISRITDSREDMLIPYRYFSLINMEKLESGINSGFTGEKVYYTVRPFKYKNLKWLIVEVK